MEPKLNFEASLGELERIVGALERGDATLDQALTLYERGVHLLVQCKGLLNGAERTVALLSGIDGDGQPVTAPFDATATADREPPAAAPKRTRSRTSKPLDDEGIPF